MMVKDTGIEWADDTFNPWQGCSKVSPACGNCYAMDHVNRYGGDFLGKRVMTSDGYWKEPLKWNKEAEKSGQMRRVFCASLSDVFEDYQGPIVNHKGQRLAVWPDGSRITIDQGDILPHIPGGPRSHWMTMSDARLRLFNLIDSTPNLVWMLLTKRPENISSMWNDLDLRHQGKRKHRQNVWLGTTVENQEQADKRIPELLKCSELAPVLFLSCEPLLGPVDLSKWFGYYPIHENKHTTTRTGGLSSCDLGGASDRLSREGLEGSKENMGQVEKVYSSDALRESESGASNACRISTSQGDVRQQEGKCECPSPSLYSLSRPNIAGHDDKSQEWNQERQQAFEFGADDRFAAGDSCKRSSYGRAARPGRREEFYGQVDSAAGERDSAKEDFGGGSQVNSERFRSRLQGHIEDSSWSPMEKFWVICGGESGKNARPMHPQWALSMRDQCKAAGVPFHFKQWGEWYPIHGTGLLSEMDDEEHSPYAWMNADGSCSQSGSEPSKLMLRIGKKQAGRLLDGQEWNGLPAEWHLQQLADDAQELDMGY